jgi:hypothetical protein
VFTLQEFIAVTLCLSIVYESGTVELASGRPRSKGRPFRSTEVIPGAHSSMVRSVRSGPVYKTEPLQAFPDGAGRMLGGIDLCCATSATGISARSHRVDVNAVVRHPVGWIDKSSCAGPLMSQHHSSIDTDFRQPPHFSSFGYLHWPFGERLKRL